jgi:hypothetical protein
MDDLIVNIDLKRPYIAVKFRYEASLNQSLKEISRKAGYSWDPETRTWSIVATPGGIRAVREWAETLRSKGVMVHVTIDPKLEAELIELDRTFAFEERNEVEYQEHLKSLSNFVGIFGGPLGKFTQEMRKKYGKLWDQD